MFFRNFKLFIKRIKYLEKSFLKNFKNINYENLILFFQKIFFKLFKYYFKFKKFFKNSIYLKNINLKLIFKKYNNFKKINLKNLKFFNKFIYIKYNFKNFFSLFLKHNG